VRLARLTWANTVKPYLTTILLLYSRIPSGGKA
jgi:hypothetical protein